MKAINFESGVFYELTPETDVMFSVQKSISTTTPGNMTRELICFLMEDETEEEKKQMVAFISKEEAENLIYLLAELIKG